MKLYVPLMHSTLNDENNKTYVAYLKNIQADTVFIALGRTLLLMSNEEQATFLQAIAAHAKYFRENGFAVGIWISSFGFGDPQPDMEAALANEPHVTSISGKRGNAVLCPESEKFTALFARQIQNIAKIVQPDKIMLDDDLCVSARPGLGCFCEKHMSLYAEKFKEVHTRDELKEKIFTKCNPVYRQGWLDVIRASMRKFCQKMRMALNEINPHIAMGFCAGFTSWDTEGANAIELTKILAGENVPFLRFAGAPYWPIVQRFVGQRLNTVIEFTRMQAALCKEHGIEVFHECDTYPRPRYIIPAGVCEAFDVALRASDDMSALKYLFCYDTPPDQELGYYKRHVRNMPLYADIQTHFSKKTAVGVQVHEYPQKIQTVDLGETFISDRTVSEQIFSPAAHMLTAHSIPTVYTDNPDVAIVFGENARYVNTLSGKMILDIRAAEILQERGFDVGLQAVASTYTTVSHEQFPSAPPIVYPHATQAKACTLQANATVESTFIVGKQTFPASYHYHNGTTQFLIFTFDGYQTKNSNRAVLSYSRQAQLLQFIDNAYPYIKDNPGIYTVCKDSQTQRAVLFSNLCQDDLFDFEITLDQPYENVQLLGAEGTVSANKITVTSTIPAYGSFIMLADKKQA